MILFALFAACFCGKAFFVYEMFQENACTAATSIGFLKYDFMTSIADLLGDSVTYNPTSGCFSPPSLGGIWDTSMKFQCEGGKFVYSLWATDGDCAGSSTSDITLFDTAQLAKCYTGADLGGKIPSGYSFQMNCDKDVPDDYAHIKFVTGTSPCSDENKKNIKKISFDFYYKVGVCIKLLDSSAGSVMLNGTNGGKGLVWNQWTTDNCLGTYVSKTFNTSGCVTAPSRRGAEADATAGIYFVGYGSSELPFEEGKSVIALVSFALLLMFFLF